MIGDDAASLLKMTAYALSLKTIYRMEHHKDMATKAVHCLGVLWRCVVFRSIVDNDGKGLKHLFSDNRIYNYNGCVHRG